MELFDIEVAFALPNLQKIIAVQVPPNTNVYDIIKLSKICNYFPNMDLLQEHNHHNLSIGIFGKKIDPNTYSIQNHDRIEIYRPLNKTPNQKRLDRAKKI